MSTPDWKSDLVFKALSGLIVPVGIWIVSLSNDLVLMRERISQLDKSAQEHSQGTKQLINDNNSEMKSRIDEHKIMIRQLDAELRITTKMSTESASKLDAIEKSLNEIARAIAETRTDIRLLNSQLMQKTNTNTWLSPLGAPPQIPRDHR